MIGNQFDEWARNHYIPTAGYPKCVPIPYSQWVLGAGTPPVAAAGNIVGVGAIATSLVGHIWDSGADAADTLLLPWTLPSDFYRGTQLSGHLAGLILRVKARKRDADGTNTTSGLKLQLDAYWHNSAITDAGVETDGDTSLGHLGTVISSSALPAPVLAGAEEGFRWYDFDICGAMTAAQRAALKPRATMQLILGPSTTVGGNDFIEAVGYEIIYRGELTPHTRYDKRIVMA
jgi:hypothetical protein